MPPESIPSFPLDGCRQCGTCCRKGGPALHKADRDLIESGTILLESLETLREGQWVQDNVRNQPTRLTSDLIKIRGLDGNSSCIFLTPRNTCKIYTYRPLECQLLKCWDTAALTRSYQQNRLTRRDLIGSIPGLWDLVQTHQGRCDYNRIYALIKTLRRQTDTPQPAPELAEILSYDARLRELIAQKSPQFKAQLPFLLGQPLTVSLIPLGLQVTALKSGWRIRDMAKG